MEGISISLLKDVFDLIERLQSTFVLTDKEKNEIIESVYDAVILTEGVFGKTGRRRIIQDDRVAQAWSKAGQTIRKYLPKESLGVWLQNKGEAWANPYKWSPDILQQNNLEIEKIKERIQKITKIKRKHFRPKDL